MSQTELYVRLILTLAPLIVCLAWRAEGSLGVPQMTRLTTLSGLLFGASGLFGPLAIWGAVPWLLVTSFRAVVALVTAIFEPSRELARWCNLAASLFLPVGSIWAIADQARIQPLGFSGIIVLLTAVHFHYAGFALPWLTGRLLTYGRNGALEKACAVGVIAGVPLVAIGITSSQLSLPWAIETVAATILAFSAIGIARGYLLWSRRVEQPARVCFTLGGTALAAGMTLALLYAWRHVFPLEWLTIPSMIAMHGTLNSWGFSLPCVLGCAKLGGAKESKENAGIKL